MTIKELLNNALKSVTCLLVTLGDLGGSRYKIVGKIARERKKNCKVNFEDVTNQAQMLTDFAHCWKKILTQTIRLVQAQTGGHKPSIHITTAVHITLERVLSFKWWWFWGSISSKTSQFCKKSRNYHYFLINYGNKSKNQV